MASVRETQERKDRAKPHREETKEPADRLLARVKDRLAYQSPRDKTLDEQLLNECGAMVRYASAAGRRIPPFAAEAVSMLVHARAAFTGGDDETEWHADPNDAKLLSLAHHALARVVAPATPQSVTVLNEERSDRTFMRLLGPVRLVRWMMVLAFLLVLAFVLLFTLQGANPVRNATTTAHVAWGSRLLSALYLLCAAGLGAIFSALSRINERIETGVYDPKEESSYAATVVLGLISGVVLAGVISVNLKGLNKLTQPLLALVGGFSAPAVRQLLNALVDSVRTLFAGTGVTPSRPAPSAGSITEDDRARLTARALVLRHEVDGASLPQNVRLQLESLLDELAPTDGAKPGQE